MLASAHNVSAGGPGADNELLPFLTTDAEPLILAAKDVIAARITRFPDLGMTPAELDAAIDAIVRLVLSHVMQPGHAPARTADDLAWIVARVLGRPGVGQPGVVVALWRAPSRSRSALACSLGVAVCGRGAAFRRSRCSGLASCRRCGPARLFRFLSSIAVDLR